MACVEMKVDERVTFSLAQYFNHLKLIIYFYIEFCTSVALFAKSKGKNVQHHDLW
jgi:hypothetical protein